VLRTSCLAGGSATIPLANALAQKVLHHFKIHITIMADRKIPEINAGSMADIAFLLLVFFLVTTTIQTDTGVNTTLPPWNPIKMNPEDYPKIERRNLFDISINSMDKIIIRNEDKDYTEIKELLIQFATNNGREPQYSERPEVVVVSLKNDNGTSYTAYLNVYNEIKAAYNIIWDTAADKDYGRPYAQLTKDEQKIIFNKYPLTLSEAEPDDIEAGKSN
jgi:biopolymer transport protein ExbD